VRRATKRDLNLLSMRTFEPPRHQGTKKNILGVLVVQ
jgi:hypothetical protein